jgi:hypothetical protein
VTVLGSIWTVESFPFGGGGGEPSCMKTIFPESPTAHPKFGSGKWTSFRFTLVGLWRDVHVFPPSIV